MFKLYEFTGLYNKIIGSTKVSEFSYCEMLHNYLYYHLSIRFVINNLEKN